MAGRGLIIVIALDVCLLGEVLFHDLCWNRWNLAETAFLWKVSKIVANYFLTGIKGKYI